MHATKLCLVRVLYVQLRMTGLVISYHTAPFVHCFPTLHAACDKIYANSDNGVEIIGIGLHQRKHIEFAVVYGSEHERWAFQISLPYALLLITFAVKASSFRFLCSLIGFSL